MTIYLTATGVATGSNKLNANAWAAKNLVAVEGETLAVSDNEAVDLNIINLGVQPASFKLGGGDPISLVHQASHRISSLDPGDGITLDLFGSEPTQQNAVGPLAPYATLTLTKVPPDGLD
ncbi:MAG: hypothetical protein AB1Z98_27170 [Nannocystaceae bacterium]